MQIFSVKTKSGTVKFAAVILALIMVLAVLPFTASGVASADYRSGGPGEASASGGLPSGYIDDAWYFGADQLDVDGVKAQVDALADVLAAYKASAQFKPIVVAVVDTGVRISHELFCGDFEATPDDYKDVFYRNSTGAIVGYNSDKAHYSSRSDFADDSNNGHGTHTAGIVALMIRQLGLEDFIKIMPIKASYESNGEPSFTLTSVKDAVSYATSKADVISMSLGTTASSWNDTRLQTLISQASAQSIVVCSAGNDAKDSAVAPFYPAAMSGVISVMAATQAESLWVGGTKGSNYGTAYTMAAPGVQIYSAYKSGDNAYTYKTGTSMATPFVSFSAALLKLRYTLEAFSGERDMPTTGMLRNMLRAHSEKIVTYLGKNYAKLDMLSLMITDFFDESLDIVYSAPTSVTVSANGELLQTKGSTSNITFSGDIEPSGEVKSSLIIDWYVDGTLVGSGKTYTMSPREAGSYSVMAKVRGNESVVSVAKSVVVIYEDIRYSENVAIRSVSGVKRVGDSDVVFAGEPSKFTLSGIENADPATKIQWFVDGEEVYQGRELEYTFDTYGTHVVRAKFGDTSVAGGYVVECKDKVGTDLLYLGYVAVGLALIVAAVIWLSVASHGRAYKRCMTLCVPSEDLDDAIEKTQTADVETASPEDSDISDDQNKIE